LRWWVCEVKMLPAPLRCPRIRRPILLLFEFTTKRRFSLLLLQSQSIGPIRPNPPQSACALPPLLHPTTTAATTLTLARPPPALPSAAATGDEAFWYVRFERDRTIFYRRPWTNVSRIFTLVGTFHNHGACKQRSCVQLDLLVNRPNARGF